MSLQPDSCLICTTDEDIPDIQVYDIMKFDVLDTMTRYNVRLSEILLSIMESRKVTKYHSNF